MTRPYPSLSCYAACRLSRGSHCASHSMMARHGVKMHIRLLQKACPLLVLPPPRRRKHSSTDHLALIPQQLDGFLYLVDTMYIRIHEQLHSGRVGAPRNPQSSSSTKRTGQGSHKLWPRRPELSIDPQMMAGRFPRRLGCMLGTSRRCDAHLNPMAAPNGGDVTNEP